MKSLNKDYIKQSACDIIIGLLFVFAVAQYAYQ